VVELTDIIERCKKYDVTAQRLLYERYANQLHGVCMRYVSDKEDVNDIVQDCFIKIISKIKQYNGTGSFEGWMKRIVINTAFKHLKKNKKEQYLVDIDVIDDGLPVNEVSREDNVLNTYQSIEQVNFIKEELLAVIASIPESYRVVFNLFHLEDFSHDEIAKLLGIDVSNSRIRLLRARKLIREELVKKAKEKYKTEKP